MTWRRLLRALPFAACVSVLVWSSTRQYSTVLENGWDKLVHLSVFAVLGWTAQLAVHSAMRPVRSRMVAGVLLAAGYGAFDEWIQSTVPGRFPSAADWAADFAGVLLGCAAWFVTAPILGGRET